VPLSLAGLQQASSSFPHPVVHLPLPLAAPKMKPTPAPSNWNEPAACAHASSHSSSVPNCMCADANADIPCCAPRPQRYSQLHKEVGEVLASPWTNRAVQRASPCHERGHPHERPQPQHLVADGGSSCPQLIGSYSSTRARQQSRPTEKKNISAMMLPSSVPTKNPGGAATAAHTHAMVAWLASRGSLPA
jgi:hypothetical protein